MNNRSQGSWSQGGPGGDDAGAAASADIERATRRLVAALDALESAVERRRDADRDEDELASLRKLLGEQRIIMGSDYPHVEGLADPGSYVKDLENFGYTPDQCRTVMRDNGFELSVRRPA